MKQQVKKYSFSISGIKFDIITEKEFQITKAFTPFVGNFQLSDFKVYYEKVNELPVIPKNILYEEKYYRVHRDIKGDYIKTFFNPPKDYSPYAVSSYDKIKKCFNVKYLEKGKEYFSDFQNAFVHLGFEEILMWYKRLCLHAACVETVYGGILFSGPSGIGKTTQAENWCRYRGAVQINGDRPILSRDGEIWNAWGSPYAGSSQCHKNISCQVNAIVILKQSEECSLRKMSDLEAFKAVWSGVTVHSWDKKYMETACDMVMDLIKTIPVFEFLCTPDEQAVAYLEVELGRECYK